MGLRISPAELTREWSLSFTDIDFVNAKPMGSRLGLAAQLKFFVAHGYFATTAAEISDEAVSYLADQLGVGKADLEGYDFSGRSGRRHCAEILRQLDFRRMKRADRGALAGWIATELCPGGQSVTAMLEAVFLWCRDHKIFGPSGKEMARLVRSERQRFLECFLSGVADRLQAETVVLMEASLVDPDGPTGFHTIKNDAGAATLDNMLAPADRLAFIQKLTLPRDLLTGAGKSWIDQIVRRVGAEKASEMRRHASRRQHRRDDRSSGGNHSQDRRAFEAQGGGRHRQGYREGLWQGTVAGRYRGRGDQDAGRTGLRRNLSGGRPGEAGGNRQGASGERHA